MCFNCSFTYAPTLVADDFSNRLTTDNFVMFDMELNLLSVEIYLVFFSYLRTTLTTYINLFKFVITNLQNLTVFVVGVKRYSLSHAMI